VAAAPEFDAGSSVTWRGDVPDAAISFWPGKSAREEGFREGGSLTPFFPVQLLTVAKTMVGFYEEWCAHGPLVTRRTAVPGGAVPAEAFAISAAGAIKPQSTQRAQRTENWSIASVTPSG